MQCVTAPCPSRPALAAGSGQRPGYSRPRRDGSRNAAAPLVPCGVSGRRVCVVRAFNPISWFKKGEDGEQQTGAVDFVPDRTGREGPLPEFDVTAAVLLAKCAFDAYNDPTGAMAMRQTVANSTAVTYFSRPFVAAAYSSILQVRNIKGQGLAARDITGSSDPYLRMSVGDSVAETKTQMRTLDPEWKGERLVLYVPRDADRIRVRCNDYDLMSEDDLIGDTILPLSAVEPGGWQPLELKLRGPDGDAGTLTMEVRVMPFKLGEDRSGSRISGALERVQQSLTPQFLKEGLAGSQDDGESDDAWAALAEAISKDLIVPLDYKPIAFVDNDKTGTQLWIYCDEVHRQVVVSFRGTEQTEWKDLLTDAMLSPVVLDDDGTITNKDAKMRPAIAQAADMVGQDPCVHGGFAEAYLSVRGKVTALVDQIISPQQWPDVPGDQQWTILVTGHSLGGALATLCAYDLAGRPWETAGVARPDIRMYNFGSPRVGNIVFAQNFDERVPDGWRITNERDIVCTVPRLMGYSHVGRRVAIAGDGGKVEVDGPVKEVFEGKEAGAILPAVVQDLQAMVDDAPGLVQRLVSADEDDGSRKKTMVEKLLNEELEILSRLMDGSALSSHMEDQYLTALTVLVSGPAKDGTGADGEDAVAVAEE